MLFFFLQHLFRFRLIQIFKLKSKTYYIRHINYKIGKQSTAPARLFLTCKTTMNPQVKDVQYTPAQNNRPIPKGHTCWIILSTPSTTFKIGPTKHHVTFNLECLECYCCLVKHSKAKNFSNHKCCLVIPSKASKSLLYKLL